MTKKLKLAIGYIYDNRAVGYDRHGTCCYFGGDRMLPPCAEIIEGEIARRMLRAHDRARSPTTPAQGELF